MKIKQIGVDYGFVGTRADGASFMHQQSHTHLCQLRIPDVCQGQVSPSAFGESRNLYVKEKAALQPVGYQTLEDIGFVNNRKRAWDLLNRLYERGEITRLESPEVSRGRAPVFYTASPKRLSKHLNYRYALTKYLEPWSDRVNIHASCNNLPLVITLLPLPSCVPTNFSQGRRALTEQFLPVQWIWLRGSEEDDILRDYLSQQDFGSLIVFACRERTRSLVERFTRLIPYEPSHYAIGVQHVSMFDLRDLRGRKVDLCQLQISEKTYPWRPTLGPICDGCQKVIKGPEYCLHHGLGCSFEHHELEADLNDPNTRFRVMWNTAMTSLAHIEGYREDVDRFIARNQQPYLDKYSDLVRKRAESLIEEELLYKASEEDI